VTNAIAIELLLPANYQRVKKHRDQAGHRERQDDAPEQCETGAANNPGGVLTVTATLGAD
jgi:hypothetical protein